MGWNSEADPEALGRRLARRRRDLPLILGLDLGTNTGVAFVYHDPERPADPARMRLYLGQWDLSAGPYDSGAIRFVRLRQFLHHVRPDLVVYEQPKHTPPAQAGRSVQALVARVASVAGLFGGFQATVCAWCEEHGVPCEGLGIAELKKRATGKGNASKVDMIEAANRLFGADLDPENYEATGVDNVADAAFACLVGVERYGAGLVRPPEDRGS